MIIAVNFQFKQLERRTFHCTGRYELNKLTSLPMCGFIAQLVEHRTGIAEVTGSNPVEALIFFQASSFQLLKLEIYCDDHSSLSSVTAVQYELFHINFPKLKKLIKRPVKVFLRNTVVFKMIIAVVN